MTRFDMTTFGRPHDGRHHHRLRATAALLAAVAGGAAVVLAAMALFGAISPLESAGLWAAIAVLFLAWLTGLWWRWDAPDSRTHTNERERRGF